MSLIDPTDTIERQNEKLVQIAHSLMRRVEQKNEQSGLAYQQFERAALLESEVRERTHDLERTLDLLQESNARLEIANDETEQARSNLTEAIETINEGFALFEADSGLVLSNSRFCRDLVDIEDRLVVGLSFEGYVQLVSESEFLALPAEQSARDWAARRLVRHGEDHVVFNVRLKWDRWLQISEHRTSRGGTVILQTDVTTIMRREREERDKMRDKQAEILQATLDHLNQGVCIFDEALALVGWNSRMDGLLSGATDQGVLGMSFESLLDRLIGQLAFASDFSASDLRKWAVRKRKRPAISFEVTRGSEQIFSVFAQEIPDRGFVISFTEVTAERAAARTLSEMNELLEGRVQDRTRELGVALAEAERANASKTRFVAAASHDLLQPLSAAKLFLTSLSEEIESSAAREIMDKTEMALNSVEQFISALLDISTLDADKAVFDVQPLRLSYVFNPLRNEMSPLAVQKGIELTVVESSLTVFSDPGYLRRIVQNLLSNAIRYTDRGKVLLGVRHVGHIARIEVWDTGKGIAVEDQLKIFKEFERLSPTNSDLGLGLGLSIVERACKGLKHDFVLRSELGKGTCFSVEVPIGTNTCRPNQPIQRSFGGLSDILVLLVEPDAKEANEATKIIEGLGPTVIHAHTLSEALSILAETQLIPDVSLLPSPSACSRETITMYHDFKRETGLIQYGLLMDNHSDLNQSLCQSLDMEPLIKPVEASQILNFLDLYSRTISGEH